MADLSPVLEAYFGGQKQQADLIGQARELSDSALRRQQAQEELKQRQATIDEIAKQHGVENERQSKQDELAHQIFLDTKAYHTAEATNQLTKLLQSSNVAPDQFMNHLTSLNVPGFSAPASNGDLPGRPQPGVTLPNVQTGNANLPSDGMAHVNVPGYGPQTVAPWKTDTQQAVEQAAALLPSEVARYKQTIGSSKEAALEGQNQRLQDTLNSRQSQFDDKIAELQRWHDMTGQFKDALAAAKEAAAEAKRYNYRTPDEYKSAIDNNLKQFATGKLDLKTIQDAQERKDTQQAATQKGYIQPAKDAAKNFDESGDMVSAIASLISYTEKALQGNQTGSGKIANLGRLAAQKLIPGYTNTAASDFATTNKSLTPALEKAHELSLARAGGSPGMAARYDSFLPSLADDPELAINKLDNAMTIHLTHMQNQIATLSPVQQKAYWKDYVDTHPDVLNTPNHLGAAIFKATQTGMFKRVAK